MPNPLYTQGVSQTLSSWLWFVGKCDDYEIPYYDQVANDPSFEEMKSVVYDRGIRPHISNKWYSDDVSQTLSYNLVFVIIILLKILQL